MYPFDPTAIPDESFAPSVLTFLPRILAGECATMAMKSLCLFQSSTTGSKEMKIDMKNENVITEKTVTEKKVVMNKNQTKANENIIVNKGKNTESKGKNTESKGKKTDVTDKTELKEIRN
ncbi:hypothetical protein PR048_014091 [Dryococelus australis]|uniref:Uncharacterized protein n=1 Tax=Dryococelus australis TaxID=614101 RepID=A0ABQ9HVM9_9NEOP|nr:hypothetical protein PR048_014091 [Dryococelus australis]